MSTDLPAPLRRWPRATATFLAAPPALSLMSGAPLPPEAGERLLGRLRQGLGAAERARLEELLTTSSLSRFVDHAFEGWVEAGCPDQERWVLRGVAAFGSRRSAHRLGALVSRWARDQQLGLAVQGIEALRRLGSGVAMLRLLHLKERGAGALGREAAEALAQLAQSRGVPTDTLEASIAPDLELDAEGRLVLDLGPERELFVHFDGSLAPRLITVEGERLSRFPARRKSDDDRYDEARETWSLLGATVRTLASAQLRRLERVLWGGAPPFSRRTFVETFLDHALLRLLAARLLWAAYDDQGQPVELFRVAEDGTLADIGDEEIPLPEADCFGPVHPVHLSGGLRGRWRGRFDDYELLQPFAQLDREVFRWPEGALGGTRLRRCEGWSVPPGRLVALCARGWRERAGSGLVTELHWPAGAVELCLRFHPGYSRSALGGAEPVTLEALEVCGWNDPAFSDLSEVARSEVLRDLESLRDPSRA